MSEHIFTIRRADKKLMPDVRRVCETRHYLHRYPDPRSLPFAYALVVDGKTHSSDGNLHGIIVFKKPQHHAQRGLFGYEGLPTAWQVLDMGRVWINPSLQQPGLNVFSRMVSLVMHRVQWDWLEHHPPRFPDKPYHIELVISYCELAHHDGAAYKACSFTSAGPTTDKSKELYIKKLRPPLKSWLLHTFRPVHQIPMFRDMPIKYR